MMDAGYAEVSYYFLLTWFGEGWECGVIPIHV